MRGPIPDNIWSDIEAEFTLPALALVKTRLEELTSDPAPVLRGMVRVFIGDGTYCPGFQFQADRALRPSVAALFVRAMRLGVPHNYFAAWMITPSTDLGAARPVDLLDHPERLTKALELFAAR